MARRFDRADYTVGWVCALPIELTAAQVVLDEEHEDLPQVKDDANVYTLGSVGGHNVVIACLPAGQTGVCSAAAVAVQMKTSFGAIRFGMLVGIGGGVPSDQTDIRLGDVVVSQPEKGHGGVVQYDFGKTTPHGFERAGFLNAPPRYLLAAVAKLRANITRGKSGLAAHLSRLNAAPDGVFERRKAGADVLFQSSYNHVKGPTCTACSVEKVVEREDRGPGLPVIHYGTIASGSQFFRYGTERDNCSSHFGGVLCFDMVAAGLMNHFPSLVIRGICDYADSHRNKKWQPYAAATAAAYAKEILLVLPPTIAAQMETAIGAIRMKPRALCSCRGSLAAGRSSTPVRCYLPSTSDLKFVCRRDVLDRLERKLFVEKDCQKIAIAGSGGTGKTMTALRFAYAVRQNHPDVSIFWISALSIETFDQACEEIAELLDIPPDREGSKDAKQLVRQQLSAEAAGKWLLIVDNADDDTLLNGTKHGTSLLDVLPESSLGLTLFTTRAFEVAQGLVGSDFIEIERSTDQDPIESLEGALYSKQQAGSRVVAGLNPLAELDFLPLAVAQAAG